MRFRFVLGMGLATLLAITSAFVVTSESIGDARAPASVVFVCRNGVAMSVWSAGYFNRLARARGLTERAVSRAAVPSFREVPANMVLALALDGFVLGGYRPAVVSAADTQDAEIIVAIDTELPAGAHREAARTEHWQGFPPMREQYFPSRKALKARVQALVDRLAAATPPASVADPASDELHLAGR